jgi:CBS domain containing-hemolysin-like protein
MSSGFIDGVTGGLSRFFKRSGSSKTGSSPARQEPRNTPPGRKGAEIDQKTIRSLESDKKEMIQGIVELSGTTVKEVMVPRTDTVFLSVDDSRDGLLACIAESEHSRFPVFEETIDNVIGILYVKDVLRSLVKDEPFDVK